ncbi:putative ariadne-like RING finger protein [Glarea lozoyensis 74030]|uniref:Putative ariadne-like RING finger protein n=1 Tax=Glarea lozoyensis (strain ATCC 74030 / MF5533) TaxID=1104152 RepID=H0EEF9_GLAL7|nr:putative ariadne-like RING finger protein [Glarea lozoyensis 74030]
MDSTPSLPTQAPEIYDLLLLIDATYNTGPTLNSLSITLPHLLTLTTVTTSFSRLSILAYRAYFPPTLILSFSGWKDPSSPTARAELTHFAQTLHPDGGGDEPEAMKTALARAYEVMRPEATTLVLFDRDNDARGDLTTAFRKSIEKIKNIEKKVRMKIWLEESYDFTVDIQEAIESVGEDQQFPDPAMPKSSND